MIIPESEEKAFKKAKFCHICQKEFSGKDNKVRDHCHETGRFRGAAHDRCNINYFSNRYLPVVFHNLRGYDSHLIIREAYNIAQKLKAEEQELEQVGDKKVLQEYNTNISCIPSSYEKFISFNIGELKFIDSFQFMASSLEKLVDNLYESDDKYNFNFMNK